MLQRVETGQTKSLDMRAIGIGKSFGNVKALDGVNLDIAAGEFLTFLGPSGSGKTTLLMILAGFENPSAGRLMRGAADITRQPAEERAFGMMFQGYALFPHMTVEQNIAFPLRVRRQPRGEIERKVSEIIARVGLAGHEKKPPSKLSGGQQQRVALARALVFDPSLLLLDEPFSALDKHLRGRMQEEVKRLHQDLGTTFVFVTHDQSEALSLSSRIAIFNHGQLLQVGSAQDVYERPATRFVAEFLGEINLLALQQISADHAGIRGVFETASIAAPGPAPSSGRGILAVRPEHMTLSRATDARSGNCLPVTVTNTSYFGATTKVALVTKGGSPLTLTLPTAQSGALQHGSTDLVVTWPFDKGFVLALEPR